MKLPKGATVAVADGAKLVLFRNTGTETGPELTLVPHGEVETHNKSAGQNRPSVQDDRNDDQLEEFAFAAGVAEILNKKVLTHKIDALVVIAAPRTLGELRRHYHKELEARLVGEIAKDLTGHSIPDILKAIAAA